MVLRDVIASDGRIFLKSEWGPMSDEWPAVSFSKSNVGEKLRREFNPDRDAILYVGTAGPRTEQERHRQRVLSAVKVEPNVIYDTRSLVPPESWERAQQSYKGRWERSMSVRRAWAFVDPPLAPEIIPVSYRSLGTLQALGNVIEVQPTERNALVDLAIALIALKLQGAGTAFDDKRAAINLEESIKKEIGRMVIGIRERVRNSGTQSIRNNPLRTADSELIILFQKKWREQNGTCALCGGDLVCAPDNRLLQCSADRVDSALPSYDASNVHITHLGCNLAKNDVPMEQFQEWIEVVRASGDVAS